MSREGRKAKRRVNPFDVVIILLVLCLVATFGYRIYKGVADKNDSNISSYVMTFECNGKISSLAEYLKAGTPVYIMANGELLGYVDKGALKVVEITENVTEAPAESESDSSFEETEELETAKPLPYTEVNIEGKIQLSRDLKVYSNGVYYTIGDLNFAPGSTLTLYTEEAAFTVTVKSIARVD